MRLIVGGTITLDRIEFGERSSHAGLGGSALYAAAAASVVGPTAVAGVVGSDFDLDELAFLEARGVDVSALHGRSGPTFRWCARYQEGTGERITLSREPGVAQRAVPKLPSALTAGRPSVLLASTDPEIQAGILDQIPNPGWVGLDTMEHWIQERRAELRLLMRRVHVLFVTEEEACRLAGERAPTAAADRLLAMGPVLVVVKQGDRGSWVKFPNGNPVRVPAAVVADAIETTGAGDALAGAFMASLLDAAVLSESVALRALRYGSALAACAVGDVGIEGLRTVDAARIERVVHGMGGGAVL